MFALLPALMASLLVAASARATTSAQFLYGTSFHDRQHGTQTQDGHLFTLTLEHYSPWTHGDQLFFIDAYHGKLLPPAPPLEETASTRLFAEWEPRLGLKSLLAPAARTGSLREIFLAAQLTRASDDFWSNALGTGIEFGLGTASTLGANILYRKDRYNDPTCQFSPYWIVPFSLGRTRWRFGGFMDFFGTDSYGIDFHSQPQLLVDLHSLAGRPGGHLYAGMEAYLHRNRGISTHVLQAMAKWAW